MTVEFTDTDFTATGVSTSSISGLTDGSVTFKTYSDSGNAQFGEVTLLNSFGPTSAANSAMMVTTTSISISVIPR